MFKNKSLKKDLSFAFLLTLLSTIGTAFVVNFQLNSMSAETIKASLPENVSVSMYMLLSIVQGAVTTFIMAFLGLKLAKRVNLNKGLLSFIYNGEVKKYKLNKQSLMLALKLALVMALVTSLSEKFIWPVFIPEVAGAEYSFNLQYIIAAVLYGGIGEEVMLRLFVMSLLIFILWKVFKRDESKENIPSYIYWTAVVISALLFAIGHLPATLMSFNVTIFVILRMIILNGLGGMFFGYLYWKKGFEYAIIAHMFSHIFMQLVLNPILF